MTLNEFRELTKDLPGDTPVVTQDSDDYSQYSGIDTDLRKMLPLTWGGFSKPSIETGHEIAVLVIIR